MSYIIREAEMDEIRVIQTFLHQYWKENHSLAISSQLINFQHYDINLNHYNFIIAINDNRNELDGIMGYIPTYQYDNSLINNGDYWGAIWKVRDDIFDPDIKILGFLLWEYLMEKQNFKTYAAIGISSVAKLFYKSARLKTGILNQYYIAREQDFAFKVAGINFSHKKEGKSFGCIDKIDLDHQLDIKAYYYPLKSINYLINRYEKHPIYQYSFWKIMDKVILVTRSIIVNETKIIRVVDCLGNLDDLPCLYHDFQEILEEENAEYIDFINYGIDEDIFKRIGFSKLDPKGDIIIPNYFEPFLQKNIEIEFAYKSPYDNYTIFKGDSDQDRPNIII